MDGTNLSNKIVYNPNDHGITLKITMPDNTGFDLAKLIAEINRDGLIYTADSDVAIGKDRVKDPIVEIKLA